MTLSVPRFGDSLFVVACVILFVGPVAVACMVGSSMSSAVHVEACEQNASGDQDQVLLRGFDCTA